MRTNALDYYLVVCEHPDHPPHAYIIEADSVTSSLDISRYRYVLTVDLTTSEQVTAQATPYRALPEIMFSGKEG